MTEHSLDAPSSDRPAFSVQRILLEAISIVFAVLLALGVDEWRDTRQLEEKAKRAHDHVVEEIRSNKKFLTLLHQRNSATVEFIMNDPDSKRDTSLTFTPGLQLKNTAWITAQNSGLLSSLDYAVVLQLSDIYALQGIYREIGMQMTQAIMQATADAGGRGEKPDESRLIRSFSSWLSMLNAAEAAILQRYDAVLAAPQDSTNVP